MIEPNNIPGGKWFHAGEIIVASDSQAERPDSWVRRNQAGHIELLSVRNGPSGSLATIREITEKGPMWRYIAQGETEAELIQNLDKMSEKLGLFTETLEDSIADICARHAFASMREMELRGQA